MSHAASPISGGLLSGAALFSLFLAFSATAQVGHRLPSERRVVKDAKTGVEMVVLTDGDRDSRVYHTHPQWTADGKWIVFRSSGRADSSQAYAVNEQSGDIVQLTDGPGNNPGSICVARKSMKLYFLKYPAALRGEAESAGPTTQRREQRGPVQIVELDLGRLLTDAMSDTTNSAPASRSAYERVCATLPEGMRDGGGQALDADEKVFYLSVRGGDVGQHLPAGTSIYTKEPGMRMGTGPGGLRKIDLATGKLEVVIDTPFQIGHLQSNPWVSGEMMYCHETGGDAPQRMWSVLADGSGNRPLFKEEPLDWVTHETIVGKDEVMFNLMGHQERLRVRPTGIAVMNLRTDSVQLIGQLDEPNVERDDLPAPNGIGPRGLGGFWHCNGSPDGRWAAGDTFRGDIYLIDRQNGRRILLSTDHKMKPDHAHPTFSDDSKRLLIQSGHFTEGKRLQLVVLPVSSEAK